MPRQLAYQTTAALILASLAGTVHAQCGSWLPGATPTGVEGRVVALIPHDPDGPGPLAPVLIAGGSFEFAGGDVDAAKVAWWDGTRWSNMVDGPLFTWQAGSVSALTSFDADGTGPGVPVVVAGGLFGSTVSRRNVAWWDGSAWQSFGAGLNNTVLDLKVFDADGPGPGAPQLIAAGIFTDGGSFISRWTGSAWASLGAGVNGSVSSMVEFDADGPGPGLPVLVACGNFTQAGGASTSKIATWNGTTWSTFGSGPPGSGAGVNAVGVWDQDGAGPLLPTLFAQTAQDVSRWDGSAWISTGAPQGGRVLQAFDPDGPGPLSSNLFAGGNGPGGNYNVWRWDGVQWHNAGAASSQPFALTEFDGRLVAGGEFAVIGSAAPRGVAAFDGAAWSALDSESAPDDTVRAFGRFDPDGPGPAPEELVVGGDFRGIDGKLMNYVARWDGTQWRSLAGGVSRGTSLVEVHSFAKFDFDGAGPQQERLVVSGRFTEAGGLPAGNIAAWDGTAWSAIGAGLASRVEKVHAFDPDGAGPAPAQLFAGGSGLGLWEWTGSAWVQRSATTQAVFSRMSSFDIDGPGPLPTQLLVPGDTHVLRWDGVQLVPMPGTFDQSPHTLAVFDADGAGPLPPELHAGGNFSLIDGAAASGISRWTGAGWVSITAPFDPVPALRGMAVYDADGAGPQPEVLAAFGNFDDLGSTASQNIAFWTGTRWVGADIGVDEVAIAAEAFDPDGPGGADAMLFVGGTMREAGGQPSWRLARWQGSVAPYATDQPDDTQVAPGGTADFFVTAAAISGSLTYQWLKNGVLLVDGGAVSGAMTDHLVITGVGAADNADYSCEIADDCATNESLPARLLVLCAADLTLDGQIDFADYLEFLNLYEAADPRADLDGDSQVDFADYLEFLNHFDAGC